jgi:predicted RND superfamily exporter protein
LPESFIFTLKGAWGLLAYCGYSWQAINLASVFLLLGVGLDDTFVMLSAWRHTDSNAGVEERMRECYKVKLTFLIFYNLTQ